MAKLISKKTREIITTSTVILIVALFVTFYIVYPLITVRKMTGRPDIEKFEDPDYLPENDPSYFADSGLNADTLTIETDDNIKLAALYFKPDSSLFDSIKGTAILIHHSDTDRTSLSEYIQPLLDSGLAVVLYDSRSCGLSTGRYHYGGVYEADDLAQVIAYLNLHSLLLHPLTVVGFEIGADAAIYASRNENRIDYVVAIEPFLTTTRWITKIKERYEAYSIPLYKTIYFWWFQKRTDFVFDRTGVEDIVSVGCKTQLIMDEPGLKCEETQRLRQLSADKLTLTTRPEQMDELNTMVLKLIYSAK